MQQTIPHLFFSARAESPDRAQFFYKKGKNWRNYTRDQFALKMVEIANFLANKGVKKGDRLAIMSGSRIEWGFLDMSSLCLGAIVVPIYQSNTKEDFEFIINDSKPTVLVLENEAQWKKWLQIRGNCPSVTSVVLFEHVEGATGAYHFDDLSDQNEIINDEKLQQSAKSLTSKDIATIIYTSGTTGTPKGVTLSHKQISSEVAHGFSLFTLNQDDICLSFLPYAHIIGRVEFWGSFYINYQLAFAEGMDKIKENLVEIKPTFLVAVPRIFEKIYNGVLAQAETSRVKFKVFQWANKLGRSVSQSLQDKQPLSIAQMAQYRLAKKIVFDRLLDKLGGRLRFAICGGAPLDRQVAEFFHASGLLICEGYGLTETTAAIAGNSPSDYEFGTVGKPLAETEIKIASDGEILVKSPMVMLEYFNNPKATADVFDEDGFFKTGDIGEWTKKGMLKITDRKKDLIKTAGGKYIAPQKLEGLVKLSPYISNVLIYGDRKKYIVALVTLDENSINGFAKDNEISHSSMETLVKNELVQKLVRDAVAEANSQLASYETIKAFHILDHDFTIEDGTLTPSLKVKRNVCNEEYADILESLY